MLPEGWKATPLSEIAESKIVYGIVQAGPHDPSGIPYLRSSDVGGRIKVDSLQKTSVQIHNKYARSAIVPGNIVISLRGNIGATSIVPPELQRANLTQGTARIAVSGNYHTDYIKYQIDSEATQQKIQAVAKGSTFIEITLDDLRNISLLNPASYREQRKIAEILATWDRAIAVQERLIANARAQKKAMMQILLTAKKRLPGYAGVWRSVQLGECAVSLDNQRVPINGEQRQAMQGTIPYYGANGVLDYVNNHIFDESLVLLAEDGGYFDEYETRPIAQLIRGKSWVNNHAHILRNRSNATIEWIFFSLVHRNILEFINGGTRAKLNKSDMLKIPLVLPKIDEQTAICDFLQNVDRQIELLSSDRDRLAEQKSALMQLLLTGKHRVKIEENIE